MQEARLRPRSTLLAVALAAVALGGCQGVIGDGAVEPAQGGEPGADVVGGDTTDVVDPDAGGPDGDGEIDTDASTPPLAGGHPWIDDVPGTTWPPSTGGTTDPDCVDDLTFFAETAWPTVFASQCLGCHNADGIAATSRHVLVDAYQQDHLQTNLAVLASLAPLTDDTGQPLLLSKPTGHDHAGGTIFEPGSDSFEIIEELLARFESPTVSCATGDDPDHPDEPIATPGEPTAAQVADHLVMMSPVDTLRVAALSLTGRLPDNSETAAVEAGGEAALDAALTALMNEEGFYVRLKEVYNDLLLTDLYDVDDNAIELLDLRDFPNRWWFDDRRVGSGMTDATQAEMDLGMIHANHAVATEPLELIAHVVRQGRPLTEILTADYAVMNAFAARSYDAYDASLWADPTDPEEVHEVHIPGREHAGVLTSVMFLNRFPTTATNHNRHRARMVFKKFLATDLLAIAERPIELDSVLVDDPTANAPACTVCHSVMDPVAATFRSWTDIGRYRPGTNSWANTAFPPGFDGQSLPAAELDTSVSWLAHQLAVDPRFATATVNLWFESLTGFAPRRPPQDPSAPDYARQLQLFQVQNADLQALASDFVASNYDLKSLIRAIILSPYFRATGVDGTSAAFDTSQVDWQLQIYGLGRPLPPKQLHRKIVATLGFPYRSNAHTDDYLTTIFRVPYGGINSDDVVDRMRDFNGMMGNIALRMANHMACIAVPQDFAVPASQRLLFPQVERTQPGMSMSGVLDAADEAAVRDNIVHLHEWLLAERLTPSSPEVEATLSVFVSTLVEGQAALANGTASATLDSACRADTNYWSGVAYSTDARVVDDPNYAVRAWMAVVSYLLMDYRFLHQ